MRAGVIDPARRRRDKQLWQRWVILWGGPLIEVAIDGRADRYGKRFISDDSKLMSTMGDWQQKPANLDPHFALLRFDEPPVTPGDGILTDR